MAEQEGAGDGGGRRGQGIRISAAQKDAFLAYLAARLSGEDNRTAMGIGALMNSRGLMELIIINIGLQKGIIGPTLFSILVLMAIVTTMMARPLFELVYGRKARASGVLESLRGMEERVPLARPQSH